MPGNKKSAQLTLALKWWSHALRTPLYHFHRFEQRATRVVDLCCDAAGEPQRLAAVLVDGATTVYTDLAPSTSEQAQLRRNLVQRKDSQIVALELLAIVLGLTTFEDRLKHAIVRVWTDNGGGEGAIKKGSGKAWDHNLIVHGIWLIAARHSFGIWFGRVPTKDNISDSPSRSDYKLLNAMRATRLQPKMPDNAWDPQGWATWQ
jgi:hypothetical protein